MSGESQRGKKGWLTEAVIADELRKPIESPLK